MLAGAICKDLHMLSLKHSKDLAIWLCSQMKVTGKGLMEYFVTGELKNNIFYGKKN